MTAANILQKWDLIFAHARNLRERSVYITMNEEKLFGIGAGRLYIAPAWVDAERSVSVAYYAGPTRGGVTLAYQNKIHEITDYYGRLIRQIPYGDRIRVEGRLARLYPQVMNRLIGAPQSTTAVRFGESGEGGRAAQVRVTLVCTLPESAGGGEMCFSMLASAVSGAAMAFSADRDSSVSFSLTGESDGAGFSGRLVFS